MLLEQTLTLTPSTPSQTFCRFGHTIYFEYTLKNPFGAEERFTIDFNDPELRIVTSSEEWMYLRRRVVPAVGTVGEWPIEHDMIDGDSKTDYMLTLQAHESVSIPFTLLSIDPGGVETGKMGERSVNVR